MGNADLPDLQLLNEAKVAIREKDRERAKPLFAEFLDVALQATNLELQTILHDQAFVHWLGTRGLPVRFPPPISVPRSI